MATPNGPAASIATAGGDRRELIVITKPSAGVRALTRSITSVMGAETASLEGPLTARGAVLRPLFGLSEDRLQAQRAALLATHAVTTDAQASAAAPTPVDVPDLSVFYHVEAADEHLDALA